jgi:FkbM family methyltransferase
VSGNWRPSPRPGGDAVSYSQNAEDIRLARVFDRPEGFYVDVGAGHPTVGSVTRLFYDRGWAGINVEPGPMFGHLVDDRPRDVNLKVAVLPDRGVHDFWVSDSYWGLSTVRAPDFRRLPEGAAFRKTTVDCVPLTQILVEHASGRTIDFLSIDVEGAEADVLRSTDFARFRPRVVVIEAVSPITFEPSHEAWEPLVREAGYSFAAFDGINRFYVDEAQRDLIPALAYPISVLDQYSTAESLEAIESMIRSPTWRAGRIVVGPAGRVARLARWSSQRLRRRT